MSKSPGDEVTVTVPRREGLVFQLQNLQGTNVWVVVVKGELSQLAEKARRWDIHCQEVGIGDRVCCVRQCGEERRVL